MAEKKQHTVGKTADFPVGKFKIIEIGGREIGIAQLKNGEFRAVRNVCPHKGAPVCKGPIGGTALPSAVGELIYGRDGEILACPWHGFEFDLLTGDELIRSGKPTKLLMFPVAVANGNVLVTV
jgi:3-phenylpropionate/trans-cinnamate dioxygenase ferredoxin subunit